MDVGWHPANGNANPLVNVNNGILAMLPITLPPPWNARQRTGGRGCGIPRRTDRRAEPKEGYVAARAVGTRFWN